MPSNQLRVFGDRTKFRRKLRDRIRAGMHLLDECEGGRLRLAPATDTGLRAQLENFSVVETLAGRTDRWYRENRALVATHLGADGADQWPTSVRTERGAPHAARLEEARSWIEADLLVLRQILSRVPARRALDPVAPTAVRLDELWNAGLLDPEVLRSYEQRMSGIGSRQKAPVAIGAAKELVEATLKAALERLDEAPPPPTSDFLAVAKRVRAALRRRAAEGAPDGRGTDALDRFQSGLAGALQALDEWRNLYGTGHGHARLPSGLKPRHARIAVDVAETYVRFLVSTLDDLGLLGGTPHGDNDHTRAPEN